MFCDYELSSYRGDTAAESDNHEKWSVEPDQPVSQNLSLEEEIHMLRLKMEEIFLQEQSFTSDIVIEISSLLDLKINEYMRLQPRKKL